MKPERSHSTYTNSVAAWLVVLLLNCTAGHAVDRYVSLAGGHVPPFTDWASAATNIQEAIDASADGDVIWVTNGVYSVGGKVMAGDLTNRVALDKALTVQSVNGPFVTTIKGNGSTNGINAVRCAWLTNGAVLRGFTLQAGATRVSGDSVTLLNGGGAWCASSNAFIANCAIRFNAAQNLGAGAYRGTLNNCWINGNAAGAGGGGAGNSVLINCTVTGNSAGVNGGGVSGSVSTNCIVWANAGNNFSGGIFAYCCTAPLPAGPGNLAADPTFIVDGLHLATASPCRQAGINAVNGDDIDGLPWLSPPSIGCDEIQSSPLIVIQPTLKVSGGTSSLKFEVLAAGEPATCFWSKDGSVVENGGRYGSAQTSGLLISNFGPQDAGNYQVIVSNLFGSSTSVVTRVGVHCVDAAATTPMAPYSVWENAATNIQDAVDVASPGDVVVVTNGVYRNGGKVMAGNLTNRVALDKPLIVVSVNGRSTATILGAGGVLGTSGVRCAWLTNGAALSGFTLKGGATRTSGDGITLGSGGGVWCASTNGSLVANCLIISNAAFYFGGGCYQGTLENCVITGNGNTQGGSSGGGCYQSVLKNCAVIENTSTAGGGLHSCVANSCTVVRNSGGGNYGGKLTNCIVYFNTGGNTASSTSSYCCITPLPAGLGNISGDPLLVGDYLHISSTSPCRGAGTNLVSGMDIDGQPWATPPSIGCDEWRPEPFLISLPVIQPVNAAAGFTISVSAIGQEPFWCLWTRNGVSLEAGANYSFAHTTNLLVRNASLMLDGQFQVVVSNSFGMVTSSVVQLTVHCVDAAGNTPTPPFTSWATAATNIQDAINVALPGELVLVTNGVYGTGGKVMAGDLTNRVALDKALMVASVNGAATTIIQGAWDPVATNGPLAVRCAWLTNGATLSGFTLRRGATRSSGTSTTLHGGGVWCVSSNAVVTHCRLIDNSASSEGGGVYQGSIHNCVLTNNTARYGGGVAFGVANNSLIAQNGALNNGGGAYFATLNNCTVTFNYTCPSCGSLSGAGTYRGTTRNSIVLYNTAGRNGVTYANYDPGAPYSYCCTSPSIPGGPMPGGVGNINASLASPQLLADGIHLAATSPCRGAGTNLVGGVDIDGQSWLNPPSIGCDEWQPEPIIFRQPRPRPTIGVGRTLLSVSVAGQEPFSYTWRKDGADLQDGGKYSSTQTADLSVNGFSLADAGTYQGIVSNSVGVATSQVVQISVYCVDALSRSPTTPYSTWATAAATIQDAIEAAKVGDVILVTNGIYASRGKAVSGSLTNRVALDKAVLVSSVNGPAVTIIEGQWDPVSTNGPGAVRCAWLASEAGLSGFTLRNGATLSSNETSGGGAWCASANSELANCVITNCSAASYAGGLAGGTLSSCSVVGNFASSAAGAGGSQMFNCVISRNRARFGTGGVDSGLLYNCLITENTAASLGGGVTYSRLINCTVVNNSSGTAGGGVASSTTVSNCIVFFNSAPSSPNIYASQVNYSCSTPLPVGVGNISNDPQLTDGVHLAATSPCRGMGSSLAVTGTDFEGDPWANPPSMGCDEVLESAFAGPLSVALTASYPEVAAYGAMPLVGRVIGRASRLEWSFGDGPAFTNLSYLASYAWSDPGDYTVTFTAHNADNPGGVSANLVVHVVPLVSPQMSAGGLSGTNFSLSFPGQPGVTYVVEQTTNLVPPVTWRTVQSVLSPGALMQVTDTRATNTMRFYRVRTQ